MGETKGRGSSPACDAGEFDGEIREVLDRLPSEGDVQQVLDDMGDVEGEAQELLDRMGDVGSPVPDAETRAAQPLQPDATSRTVARWMQDELDRHGRLEQHQAANGIRRHFGNRFVYTNDHGNWAISPDVLVEFGKLNRDTVVWVRHEREWRLRTPGDPASRQV